jgi:hypothetical protein
MNSMMTYKLKLKNQVKQLIRFCLRFIKRSRGFYFFSPEKAWENAIISKGKQGQYDIEKMIAKYKIMGLVFKEDLISIPLIKGKKKEYYGGLVDCKTGKLIDEAIHFDGDSSQEFSEQKDIRTETQVNQVVFFGGILYDHFGHVLLDSISRLWAYSLIRELDPYIYFYVPWDTPRYLEKDNYLHQILEGFNIPPKKIIFSAKPAKLRKVIIAPQKYGYGLCKSPDEHFMSFLKSFIYRKSVPQNFVDADKIYVSRTKIKYGLGKPIGEKYFEEFLKSAQYKIFYPERYTLNEQLTVYSNAAKIIFCEGSALHACILLPAIRAEIAIISRRKDFKRDVNLITDQFIGFKKDFLWIDEVGKQYQFGLETWSAISEIDWYKVSYRLWEHKFIDNLFTGFTRLNYNEIIQEEIKMYIEEIRNRPEFINFLKANHEGS